MTPEKNFTVEDGVTLKEFFQDSVEHVRDDVVHLRELMDERSKASDNALDIATTEIHRRLDDLNHSAARLEAVRDELVSKEVYEARHSEIILRLNTSDRELSAISLWRAGLEALAGKGKDTAAKALAVSIIVGIITSAGTIIGIIIALKK